MLHLETVKVLPSVFLICKNLRHYDMYPLYWTTSKEGIFMRYSYEFKKKCVDYYRKHGHAPEPPEGVSRENFRHYVCEWIRIEDAQGQEALKHKSANKIWIPKEKLSLVHQVLAGKSNKSVALNAGINPGMLYQWVRNYKIYGYNGLINKKKGRPSKNPGMKEVDTKIPLKLSESEYEELIRLRARTAFLEAENEVIKKEIALREEKEAARLKAKKQQSSKNSEKKDTN